MTKLLTILIIISFLFIGILIWDNLDYREANKELKNRIDEPVVITEIRDDLCPVREICYPCIYDDFSEEYLKIIDAQNNKINCLYRECVNFSGRELSEICN